MRSFIALEMPPEAVAAAERVITELRESGADVKWVKPENLHLTLKFLGEIDPGRVEEISRALEQACAGCKGLDLQLSGCGAFPERGIPRIVWLGLGGQVEQLGNLAHAVVERMDSLDFPPEKRPFKPHLTLGRLRQERGRGKKSNSGELRRVLAGLAAWIGPEFRAHGVTLMQSTLTPRGPLYDPLHQINLA